MTEWEEVARRGENHNVLFMGIAMRMFAENKAGETFGAGVQFVPKHYRQFGGARWFSRTDASRYIELLRKAEASGRLLAMGEDYERRINKTRAYAQAMRGKDFTGASNAELAKEFSRFFRVGVEHWGHAYHYIFLNRFLPDEVTAEVAKKVPGLKEQASVLLTLFTPDKPTQMREENKDIIALAQKLAAEKIEPGSSDAQELVYRHLEKYAHLGMYYFRSRPYTAGQIAEKLSHVTADEIERKKKEFAEQEKVAKRTKELIKELGLSPKTAKKIYAIKQFAFDSNYADEVFNYLVYCAMPLLKEICRRLDCSWNELASTLEKEILDALEGKKPFTDEFKSELRLRLEDHALILDDGKLTLLFGHALEEYAAKESKAEGQYKHLRELKGTGVSPGLGRGKVAVVLSSTEMAKVRKGDILVTGMTTPEFVPAMQRAAAIVTDDGGMLCHAAIVSRELGIPCVVGTRVATKALADGEEVEVDAVKGIVRKIR